jgi:hypothetical protein
MARVETPSRSSCGQSITDGASKDSLDVLLSSTNSRSKVAPELSEALQKCV